jgi:hypothetical protein
MSLAAASNRPMIAHDERAAGTLAVAVHIVPITPFVNNHMTVTAWNNGRHLQSGGGYGIKIEAVDRDRYFVPKTDEVVILLDDGSAPFRVNTKKWSFWSPTCRELISKRIGLWMLNHKIAPWPVGCPPKLRLDPDGVGAFRLLRK